MSDSPPPLRIALIGGGLSGASCAAELLRVVTKSTRVRVSVTVTLFEAARGCGGRMSCKREQGFVFHHGAPIVEPREGED